MLIEKNPHNGAIVISATRNGHLVTRRYYGQSQRHAVESFEIEFPETRLEYYYSGDVDPRNHGGTWLEIDGDCANVTTIYPADSNTYFDASEWYVFEGMIDRDDIDASALLYADCDPDASFADQAFAQVAYGGLSHDRLETSKRTINALIRNLDSNPTAHEVACFEDKRDRPFVQSERWTRERPEFCSARGCDGRPLPINFSHAPNYGARVHEIKGVFCCAQCGRVIVATDHAYELTRKRLDYARRVKAIAGRG
jgi:hypothetical protein